MTEPPATNAAEQIAASLRHEIISRYADGDHLGAADDLAARFGVSTPTVRQALRILEAEGLVWVRRGNSGGYFASTPSVRVVSRSASTLLQRQGMQLSAMLVCAEVIAPEVAALAAASDDSTARAGLATYVEQAWAAHEDTDADAATEIAVEMGRRIADLCGNPPLALFSMMLTDLIVDLHAQFVSFTPKEVLDRVTRRAREGHLMLARAVGKGDAVGARLAQHFMNTAMDMTFALDS